MTTTEDDIRAVYAARVATRDLTGIEQRVRAFAADLGGADGAVRAERRRSSRTWVTVASACAGVAVVAACISLVAAQRGSRPGPSSTVSGAPTASDLSFPLDAYRPSPRQKLLLRNAEFTLANRCARSYGVALHLPTDSSTPRSDFIPQYAANIRPVSLAEARRDGYHLPPSGTSTADDILDRLSAAQRSTVLGCIDSAAAQLSGGGSADSGTGLLSADGSYVDNDLIAVSVSQVYADHRLTATYRAWSQCMATAGYPNLVKPTDPVSAADLAAPPSHEEIQQAIADVGCKNRAGLTKVWAGLVRANQNRMVAQQGQKLAAIRSRLHAAVVRAAIVLRR